MGSAVESKFERVGMARWFGHAESIDGPLNLWSGRLCILFHYLIMTGMPLEEHACRTRPKAPQIHLPRDIHTHTTCWCYRLSFVAEPRVCSHVATRNRLSGRIGIDDRDRTMKHNAELRLSKENAPATSALSTLAFPSARSKTKAHTETMVDGVISGTTHSRCENKCEDDAPSRAGRSSLDVVFRFDPVSSSGVGHVRFSDRWTKLAKSPSALGKIGAKEPRADRQTPEAGAKR